MNLATLTLAGCLSALPLTSASATAATPRGSPPLPREMITTISVVTTMRATVRVPAAQGAQSLGWSSVEKVSDYPWPTGILLAPWVAETATGTWAITTVTFWTARWLQHPTTPLVARASGGASKRRKEERARNHLRSYHWRGQEGTTRPHPVSHCLAARSTCDSFATEQSPHNSFFFNRGRVKTLLASHQFGGPFKSVKMWKCQGRCFPKAAYQIGTFGFWLIFIGT